MTTIENYKLSDRYTNDEGRVFMSGVQALARVPMEQLRADRAEGRNTAAFLSGYQGSPLGGFDQEMTRAIRQVPDLPIVLRPAVNEELGASAVMGSQITATRPDNRYDGVLGFWYGKSPGFDRASDALRHAVFAGASASGGAVALVGDDPANKSSTLPSASDLGIINLRMPIFYPGDVQEVLDLGRHAIALSRIAGMWTAIKIVTPVADGTASVDLDPQRTLPVRPDTVVDGVEHVPTVNAHLIAPLTNAMETELFSVRLEIARRYGVANRLNTTTTDPARPWLGIAATGYTYREVLQALSRLGLTTLEEIADAGIRLFRMQMPWPLDAGTLRSFASDLDEVIVVEEKGPTYEWLIKDGLYGMSGAPVVVGKRDTDDRPLIPVDGFLTADAMVPALRRRLADRIGDRLTPEPAPAREKVLIPLTTSRTPYFCSGCPHNWGTKVPDDALVGAGIGCSGMALVMSPDRVGETAGITCMGAEGTQWIGMEPFLERDHFIQNLGDGTFFHSGQLAIQAAVAAGVNITYKLLYNGTVAMTGGQDPTGQVGVPEIATILLAHGVKEVLITTDDTSDYDGVDLPTIPARPGAVGKTKREPVKVWNRTRIVEAQEYLATIDGVTVLIHDQACAAQARRLRKRGKAVMPAYKIAINHRVCEACGDCGDVSNCLSVQSIDTPLGPKTTIDQTSCNRDYSCLEGDCPSFMTIEVPDEPTKGRSAAPARSALGTTPPADTDLPSPPPTLADTVNVRMAGIGGTGVVTVAQILGTAAMLDGLDVRGLDQTGLSQKAGPVISDVRMSRTDDAASNLLGEGEADVIVAFDLLVGAGENALKAAGAERTVLVASSSATPTGAMIGNPDLAYPETDALSSRVAASTRAESNRFVDAAAITRGLFGDAATSNIFLLGVTLQTGLLPISADAMERAIDLNGVAVEANLASFRWGRRWAIDPAEVEAAAGLGRTTGRSAKPVVAVDPLPSKLAARVRDLQLDAEASDLVTMLAADLVAYQDKAYARRYLDAVDRAVRAERSATGEAGAYTEAVSRGLHKIMAYKDEYEVARLLIGPEAEQEAEAVGGPGAKVAWKLHPPMLKALGMEDKITIPIEVGRPLMKALAKGKRLRGTALDPFGRAEVRRVERAMIDEYLSALDAVNASLSAQNHAAAVDLATAAMAVRGYEELKLERAAVFRDRLRRGLA